MHLEKDVDVRVALPGRGHHFLHDGVRQLQAQHPGVELGGGHRVLAAKGGMVQLLTEHDVFLQ